MKKLRKFGPAFLATIVVIAVAAAYLHHHTFAVLQPVGTVGHSERELIIFAAALSLAVVIPVFTLLGIFAYKYRETNPKAKYNPDLDGSKLAETIWWIVPTVLIIIISLVTWYSSYALDPYKPLSSNKPTLHIQVVALDWKWLFIYPEQNLASVNELTIPENTPVDFEITSDSVMNSFWVPQLGGQMYAMPGMTTHLNLEASKLGTYKGNSANISGKGFADMNFKVNVIGPDLYPLWAKAMRVNNGALDAGAYAQLARPSTVPADQLHRFSSVDPNLFDTIVMKYMMPMDGSSSTGNSGSMNDMNMDSSMGMSGMQGMSM